MLHGKGGIKDADRNQVANLLTLTWGEYPRESRWAQSIPRVFISERARQESWGQTTVREVATVRGWSDVLATLKMKGSTA